MDFPKFNVADFPADSIHAVLYDYSPSASRRGVDSVPHIVNAEKCHVEVQRGTLHLYIWENYTPENDLADLVIQWWEGWVNNVEPQNEKDFTKLVAARFEAFKSGLKPSLEDVQEIFQATK